MEKETTGHVQKEWYKNWWGIIIALTILPIFAIWFTWKRTNWNSVQKIFATVGIIFAWAFISNTLSGNQQNKDLTQTQQASEVKSDQQATQYSVNQSNDQTQQNENDNTAIQAKDSQNNQLNISRNQIIKLFPEFNVTKGVAINGEDNFTGMEKKSAVVIQIIGPEDSISEASLTVMSDPRQSMTILNKQDEYVIRLINLLMPGTDSVEVFSLNGKNNKLQKGNFEVDYSSADLGNLSPGAYSTVYTFRKVNQ